MEKGDKGSYIFSLSFVDYSKNIIFLYSIALPNDLVLFLAFCKDREISPEVLIASNVADSVWGDISKYIFGRNRASFRKNIYLKWKNNSHDIHTKLTQVFWWHLNLTSLGVGNIMCDIKTQFQQLYQVT